MKRHKGTRHTHRGLRRRRKTGSARTQPRGTYAIGYGRPPKEHRFKSRQSGNPLGRPKGAKNTASKAREALRRKVTVTINGVRQTKTVEEVGFLRLSEKVMVGDPKALNYLLTLSEDVDPVSIEAAADTPSAEEDRETIASYLRLRKRGWLS